VVWIEVRTYADSYMEINYVIVAFGFLPQYQVTHFISVFLFSLEFCSYINLFTLLYN